MSAKRNYFILVACVSYYRESATQSNTKLLSLLVFLSVFKIVKPLYSIKEVVVSFVRLFTTIQILIWVSR